MVSDHAKTNSVFLHAGTNLEFSSKESQELFCNVWDVLQAQFGFGPAVESSLLRKASLTLLNIRGYRNMEDTTSGMSDQEVANMAMSDQEPCCE